MESYYQIAITIFIALGGVAGTILTNYITNTLKLSNLIQKFIYIEEKIKMHNDFIAKHTEEDKRSQHTLQKELQNITSLLAVYETNYQQMILQHSQLQESVNIQNKEYTQTIKDLTKSINKLEVTMELLSNHILKDKKI